MKKQMILAASLIISLFLLAVPMEASANAAKALKSDGSITYILGKDSSDQLIAVNTATSETIWKIKTPAVLKIIHLDPKICLLEHKVPP